jgi:Amt family ammonium transporter
VARHLLPCVFPLCARELIGAGIGISLAVVGSLVALKITELVTPLRMKEREEDTGMDLSLHGEEGYNFEA